MMPHASAEGAGRLDGAAASRGDPDMRLRQLRYFVRVCEVGSITRAAAELNIAQPALGLQIRSLEHEFEAALVVRSKRGITLTPSGQLVLEWARDILGQFKAVKARVRDVQADEAAPTISIGLTTSVTILLAGHLIEAVRRHMPHARLRIVEGFSQHVTDWMTSERTDLGLGFDRCNNRSTEFIPILKERLFFVAAGKGDIGPIRLGDVLQHPLALPEEGDSIRQTVEASAQQLNMPVINSYQVTSLQAIRDIVRRGLACTILPYGGVAADCEAGDLSVRQIVEPNVDRTLFLIRHADRPVTRTEAQFTRILGGCLTDIVERSAALSAYIPVAGYGEALDIHLALGRG